MAITVFNKGGHIHGLLLYQCIIIQVKDSLGEGFINSNSLMVSSIAVYFRAERKLHSTHYK